MNKPIYSKINWTAGMMFAASAAAAFGVIPLEYQAATMQAVGFVGPVLVWVFRTWFTEPK